MNIFLITVIVVVVTSCLCRFIKRRPHPVDQLPGPPALPVIGNLLIFAKPKKELFQTFLKLYATYNYTIFRTWLTKYIPMIHVTDPKYVELVMSGTEHISKGHEYIFLAEWLGDGLLNSSGAKWHSRRKLLTPTFHFSILEQFVPIFCDKTHILIEKLRIAAEKNPDGVDIVPYITRCALDMICQTAMGRNVNAQEETKPSPYVTAVYEISDILTARAFRPWLFPGWMFRLFSVGRRHDECLQILHGFTNKVIKERKEELRRNKANENVDPESMNDFGKKKKTAFLDLLIKASENDPSLTDDDIRAEVDTFMFEGHDTTAMGMSWILYFLSVHHDVQSRCMEELENIFSGSDRDPSTTDLNNMKYLERVIKESLRLRPSVITVARQLEKNLKLEEFAEPLPSNISMHFNILNMHRNPKYFPDPEKFDPDRFLPENCIGRHPYAYIPFSAGPRNCIGQRFAMLEMKEVVSTVLRHFRLESCNPEFYGQEFADLILRPMNGLLTRLYLR